MKTLSEDLRQDVQSGPVRLFNPDTNQRYVLVQEEVFERLRQLAGETVFTTAEMLDEIMAEDDANDPHLEEYQQSA